VNDPRAVQDFRDGDLSITLVVRGKAILASCVLVVGQSHIKQCRFAYEHPNSEKKLGSALTRFIDQHV